jgi:DNA-binding Lrp family transcriptional regulator
MDETDKRILNSLQADFPIVPKPFGAIAVRIGVKEEEVLTRVCRLKDSGLIRRIGAIFESRKLGYASALCAARVSEEKMASFVEAVNRYDGVTHNYRRNGDYNIWFTFIAPTEEDIKAFLAGIGKETGVTDILCMRAVKTFKVNAQFEV